LQPFFSVPILDHTPRKLISRPKIYVGALLMPRIARLILGLFALLLAAQTSVLSADSWPGWQGPNRDNISPDTGLLKKWPEDGPPLKWKASGLGGGYSGVAVVDGKIYSMGQVGAATGG
jgi:hypothetical protein